MKKRSLPLRAALCILSAAAWALVFILGMGLLPQSPLPLWLPLLAALAGGGLAAWFCFAPPALRRERSFHRWGLRLGAIACAALLLTLSLELFGFNHRAFTTRSCDPVELPLDFFTNEGGNYLSEDGSPIELTPDDPSSGQPKLSSVYISEVINEETVAIRCRLSGPKAPVPLTVRVEDEGSAYFYVEACQGVVLTDSPMDTFEGALYSNGTLYGLCLQFEPPLASGFYLEAVELNPQVAVLWQPLRMALCFGALLLALCMARFPWRNVTYQRGKGSHRLVILLPMLLCMAMNTAFCVLSHDPTPDGALLRHVWDGKEVDPSDAVDAYSQLFSAFQQGQLHIQAQPGEDLLGLENPYDTSERTAAYAEYYYDYALYDGQYYVYFGPAPVLLAYYPYYWLTGRIPTQLLCGLMLSLLATPLIYLAVLGIAARYARRPNLFLLSLSCFAVACVAGWPMLAVQGSRYINAVSCAVAMMAGALGFGYHALARRPGWKRGALLVLCGVCFALQGMSRANTLLVSTAMLAPGFMGILLDRDRSLRAKLGDAACFLIPALTGVGLVMAYNYARFGSVAEFGQLYQLTTEDIRYNVFRAEYIPQALWHNLLDLPAFTSTFPYVQQVFNVTNVTGNYLWRMYNLGVLTYPLVWVLFLLPASLRASRSDAPALRRERSFACLLPLAAAAALMVVDYFYAGVMERYTHDYLFALALLAALTGLRLCGGVDDSSQPLPRAFAGVYAVLCMLSILLCVLLGFSCEQTLVAGRSPDFFYALVRMFYPY